MESVSPLWLQDKPKLVNLIPGNSVTSSKMREVLSEMNIMLDPPAPKESWAHGLLQRAIQEVKDVAAKIVLANPDLSPATCLTLATNALNCKAIRHSNGFMAASLDLMIQDSAAFPIEPTEAIDFTALLQRRQAAEEIARKVKLIAPSTSCATPRCVDLFRPLLPWN